MRVAKNSKESIERVLEKAFMGVTNVFAAILLWWKGEMMNEEQNRNIVLGDEIEPDESRTPAEFANDEMLTIEQVAIRLGCSATQVREWIASGQLHAEPDGSVERIRRSEVDKIGHPDEAAAHKFEATDERR